MRGPTDEMIGLQNISLLVSVKFSDVTVKNDSEFVDDSTRGLVNEASEIEKTTSKH